MTIDDFVTYLSVELPTGYIVEKRPGGVHVYDSAEKIRGVNLTPDESTLAKFDAEGVSAVCRHLIGAFERAMGG